MDLNKEFGGDEEVGLEAKKGHELLFAGSFHNYSTYYIIAGAI